MPEQPSVIRWEPPPPTNAKGGRGRPHSQYGQLAEQLRARSGDWALVHEADNPNDAASVSGVIRGSRVVCFGLRGDFEACVRTTGGRYRVYARHLGDNEENQS